MIDRLDIEAIERLSDAAMRGGHTQTAVEGYALALRLRAALGIWSDKTPDPTEWEPSDAVT